MSNIFICIFFNIEIKYSETMSNSEFHNLFYTIEMEIDDHNLKQTSCFMVEDINPSFYDFH